MKPPTRSAFSIVELLIATSVFAGVTIAMLSYSQTAIRLVSRNFATNHSHDSVRISELRMLEDLHDSACPFRLFNFNGTTFTDATPTATTDQEPLSQKFVSTRSNGVRFRKLAGGPYKLSANTTSTSTSLTFNFGPAVAGQLPYIPQIGDKVVIPLISREFAITAVSTTPTAGSPTGTITIDDAGGIGFTINTTTTGNVTTGYFYRSVAYSVYNGQLRYHPNYTGTNRATVQVIRDKITSPLPFALLFPTATAQVENSALRVSLETYDPNYTGRRFLNGTATLQTIIPPLTIPPPVSSTDAY
jgi:hypothetical protein